MPTSAGDLLDHLGHLAQLNAAGRQSSTSAADAARVLGHLGRAMLELRRAGVSSRVGDDRDTLVAALAANCVQIAERAPVRETTLGRTAAAAADAVALAGVQTSTAGRWAMTSELLDIVTGLVDVVTAAAVGAAITDRCEAARDSAVLLHREAALHPPQPQHFEALDRPIPGDAGAVTDEDARAIRESTARLLHASEPRDAHLTIAQLLARTIAAEALTRAAEALLADAATEPGHAAASDSWRAVRAVLRPFDDGSRRPHRIADPGTGAALRLHAALQRAGEPADWPPPLRAAVAASVQLLPAHARQLERAVHRWAMEGNFVAHACDLPYQPGRAAAYLAGHKPAGVIRVGTADLRPAAAALRRSGLLTAAVAENAAERVPESERFPRHLAAAHRARIAQTTPDELGAVARRTYQQLHAATAKPVHGRAR